MRQIGYWLMAFALAASTFFTTRYFLAHTRTGLGLGALFAALVCFALLLSFALSMRDRDRRGPPIAR